MHDFPHNNSKKYESYGHQIRQKLRHHCVPIIFDISSFVCLFVCLSVASLEHECYSTPDFG